MTQLKKPFFLQDSPIWQPQPVPIDLDMAHHLASISERPSPTEAEGMSEPRSKDSFVWASEDPELRTTPGR